MSSEPPSRYSWEELLNDKDVVVLTKATFFRTVVLLFQFAEAPGRRTWEFFHYRGLEYILGTWCATFNIEGFAVSCGAQHPFIYRFKRGMHYALPDYVLLSHSQGANGEQEDQLVLVIEIKALGEVDPDTQAGRETAESIFQRTWKQRENQARLAFRSHPSQQDVHIVMASGPWFALYIYERSQLVRDGAPIDGHLLRDSPPMKRRRRDAVHADRDDTKPKDEREVRPGEAQKDAGDTGAGDNGEQEHTTDSGKRKREAKAGPDTARAPLVVINHIFQLGPSGERNALNPWFLRLLGQMKDNLERFRGEFRAQNSWFDWPTEVIPTGDGHAEGFILPTTGRPSPDVKGEDVDYVTRLDEDPVIVSVPSTPGNARETLDMIQLNALLSPTIHRTPRVFRGGSDVPSTHPLGTPPLRRQETQSVDSASGTDDAATPKAQRGRQSQKPSFGRQDRELSPSTAYLQRRQHGPVNLPQFYSAPPDSSPPRSTPPRLSWPRMDDERDSESLAVYDAGTPDPAAIPRPASAPPTSSSPPSRASRNTMAAPSVSRGHHSRPSDRPRRGRVIRPIPPSRTAQLSGTYQPPRAFHKGGLVRAPTETTSSGRWQSINTARETATEKEWQRRPPTKDELLMHALKATCGTDGKWDLMQAYRNAGMNEEQAARACDQHNKTLPSKQPRSSRPGGPSVASGSRSLSTTATYTVPLAPTRRPATHTSDRGEGPSQRPPSGVATGPSTTHAAARASSSRPPPMDGASVARTAGLNQGHSQLSNDDFPDDVPGTSRPTSAPLTSPSPRPSVTPQDFKAGSSREHHPGGRPHRSHGSIQPGPRDRSLDDLAATRETQVNRLTERIGNLGVTNVPDNAGDPKWDNPSLESLYVLGEMARKGEREVREVFRSVGMDERQVEDAHERYRLHVRDRWTDMDLLRALVASSDGTANTRPDATSAGHPREGPRRATTTSEVRSPGPSNPSRDRGEPPIPQANPGFALPGTNLDRGPMSTNTGRKGKEKQG
ncbi:hypothetical protein LXA43DRAFT_1028749 [Ganoderma leucocontextum]|nr:hypothetical protein LXA43DRAFT_1028749 [Ganoderma leucocontextum]